MKIVIDANIIISMLISFNKPLELIFNDKLQIFAPELLFIELENNLDLVLKKSKQSKNKILQFIKILKTKINIISENEFLKYKPLAINICPDTKDITYFALALYLKCPIWSNEKRLKNQEKIKVYATHELINLL